MSLDVYLYVANEELAPVEQCLECLSMPDEHEPDHRHRHVVFSQNITHNLGSMADAAGIYEACWHPEELMDKEAAFEIRRLEDAYFSDQKPENRHYYDRAQEMRDELEAKVRAHHLIPVLREGIAKLKADPEKYRKHEPKPDPHTGEPWGQHKHFVPWLEKYLAACEEYPDAMVRVSR